MSELASCRPNLTTKRQAPTPALSHHGAIMTLVRDLTLRVDGGQEFSNLHGASGVPALQSFWPQAHSLRTQTSRFWKPVTMRGSENSTNFRIIRPCIFEEKTQRQGRLSATPLSLAGKHRLRALRADDEASSFNVRAATSNSDR